MDRRDFLKVAGALAATAVGRALAPPAARGVAGPAAWDAGPVAHLIPAASWDRILLKASFRAPLSAPPRLRVGDAHAEGVPTDTRGRFFAFDARGLAPATRYELELRDAAGRPLCEAWPLRTLPDPEARPERFRLLIYTCGGGDEEAVLPDGSPVFLPLAERRALLRRGLSFRPDALLAIGDQVYLDQRTGVLAALASGDPRVVALLESRGGPLRLFDRSLPALGTQNEEILTATGDRQIAALYGTLLRSVPSVLTQDDHDYFENDRASEELVTFPPDPFSLRLARATQRLYYPELLPAPGLPAGLGGVGEADRAPGVSECFGSLRFGRLAELLIYDCRRYVSLAGARAGFVPEETERWLLRRMAAGEAAHVVNVPSTPIGWSAGKWLEWYPDVLEEPGRLGVAREKPFWQRGWFEQHNRLLRAASEMPGLPLFVSGDLHSLGLARIRRSRELDLAARPVVSVLSGPLGTGAVGWPSSHRGARGTPPRWLEVDESVPCVEENGFSLLDFGPDEVRVRLFRWRRGSDPAALADLAPFHDERLPRAAG